MTREVQPRPAKEKAEPKYLVRQLQENGPYLIAKEEISLDLIRKVESLLLKASKSSP